MLHSLRPNETTLEYLNEQLPLFTGDCHRVLAHVISQLQAGETPELTIMDCRPLVTVIDGLDDEERDPHEIIFELKMELLYGQPLVPPGFNPDAYLRDSERYLAEDEIPLQEGEIESGGIHKVELDGGQAVIVKLYDAHDHDLEANLLSAQITPAQAVSAELLAFAIADLMGEPYRSIVTPLTVRDLHGRDVVVLAYRKGEHLTSIDADISERFASQLMAAALLDAVIGEPDRHDRNWVLDRDSGQIGAFDQAHSLHDRDEKTSPGDFISWRLLMQPDLDPDEIALLERIERSYLVDQVAFYLGDAAADRLRRRLRRMIATGRIDDGTNSL